MFAIRIGRTAYRLKPADRKPGIIPGAMATDDSLPIPNCYWVQPGALLAGEYPGTPTRDGTRRKLAHFLNAGIRTFVDLTEADEPLSKYDGALRELAAEQGIDTKYLRCPIRDLGIPDEREQMERILAVIRQETSAGRAVYVHCWGGIGRTGTVVGCWLVEQGLAGAQAIARIAELRKGTPDGHKQSPETAEQRRFIREWRATRS